MANRNYTDSKVLARGLVLLHGNVTIAADASVGTSTFPGGTFTKTGTGEYTLTLEDSYVSLLGAQASLLAATAVDLVPQIKSADVVTAKTVTINLNAGATPTNPAAACTLYLSLALKNSTVLP